jgi:hypothetical protein
MSNKESVYPLYTDAAIRATVSNKPITWLYVTRVKKITRAPGIKRPNTYFILFNPSFIPTNNTRINGVVQLHKYFTYRKYILSKKEKGVFDMARKRRPLIPEAREALDSLKADVMKQKGYSVSKDNPDQVKYEVASDMHIPLTKGHNGNLTSHQAGKIGGQIGGSMVKEMVRLAQERMRNQSSE